jgi:hypothetical protein
MKKKMYKVLILNLALKKKEIATENKNFEYEMRIRNLVKSIFLLVTISCILKLYYFFFL